jgi:hypothetical protein
MGSAPSAVTSSAADVDPARLASAFATIRLARTQMLRRVRAGWDKDEAVTGVKCPSAQGVIRCFT